MITLSLLVYTCSNFLFKYLAYYRAFFCDGGAASLRERGQEAEKEQQDNAGEKKVPKKESKGNKPLSKAWEGIVEQADGSFKCVKCSKKFMVGNATRMSSHLSSHTTSVSATPPPTTPGYSSSFSTEKLAAKTKSQTICEENVLEPAQAPRRPSDAGKPCSRASGTDLTPAASRRGQC